MFTLAQPSYGYYNPYEELAMQQELQRRRQIEAYLRRQQEAQEMERRRREYEATVRAEYERRLEAELARRRQAELQRRRQAQHAGGRHSMYDGSLESLFGALYGSHSHCQGQASQEKEEEKMSNVSASNPPAPNTLPNDTPTPVPVPGASVPTSAASAPQPEPEELQVDTAPSYAAVQSILASFATLQSEFIFPTQLDFLPGSLFKLAYTPNNAPLHGYEHALTGLLTQLDAVESHGDDGVRKARKEAVRAIEKELERLDGMKAEAWKRSTESEPVSATSEVDVDPLSVPLPEDLDQEDEAMPIDLEEFPRIDQPSEEPVALTESTATDQTESITLPHIVHAASVEQAVDADSTPMLVPATPDVEIALPNDAVSDTSAPSTPDLEPPTRSPTSPSPSKASESDPDSDLESGEYVNIETIPTSEHEGIELEEVEEDGNLEMMHDWDLDF